ncbi:MAG: radical SAM family heme chaperone HemW [Planctomycetes bacterium]|nr:radical SAM family heme chaperone HemW [Planctomycetota bacterium]MCW8137263.1 radical SAM family heme chaperone HemW [Planctomycetota bacterium]
MASLYIHIPFCVRKCEYCDFVSGVAGEAEIDRYLAALERELALRFPDGFAPDTVFVGGGTPTRLTAGQWRTLGAALRRHLDLSTCREFTSEINPGTLTPDKADALRQAGVDRASFGVQSFDARFLKGLGRAYEAGTATAAVEMARHAGITRISMDLMFALPGQTLPGLRADVQAALEHGTEHLSFYALTYEDDTPLTRQLQSGEVQPCPEELEREMFDTVGTLLAQAGLPRYEVSNFARPGAECAHNLVYWQLGEWHGVGAAAHGLLDGVIHRNPPDWKVYSDAIEQGRLPLRLENAMPPHERAETLLLMGLRLTRGVELRRFRQFAGESFHTLCAGPAADLIERGLLELNETHVRCTHAGMLVLDEIIVQLASGMKAKA